MDFIGIFISLLAATSGSGYVSGNKIGKKD